MRRKEPKPKTREPTPLPADLQAFLAEVHGQIEATQLELWCCEAPGCTFRSSLREDTCGVHDWVDE